MEKRYYSINWAHGSCSLKFPQNELQLISASRQKVASVWPVCMLEILAQAFIYPTDFLPGNRLRQKENFSPAHHAQRHDQLKRCNNDYLSYISIHLFTIKYFFGGEKQTSPTFMSLLFKYLPASLSMPKKLFLTYYHYYSVRVFQGLEKNEVFICASR